MGTNPERFTGELPRQLRWKPVPIGDWIDMEFVLQEVEQEIRSELLASYLEMSANVHREIAGGLAKMVKIVGGGKQQRG